MIPMVIVPHIRHNLITISAFHILMMDPKYPSVTVYQFQKLRVLLVDSCNNIVLAAVAMTPLALN